MIGVWTTMDLAGRTADVFDPPGPRHPHFGLIFLHAYDLRSLRDNAICTAMLSKLGLACVCPQGGHFWWVDRPCSAFHSEQSPENYLLDSVIGHFRQRWGLGNRSFGLLGFSMGGQAALRLAFKYPDRFPAVAALAPALEYHELYGQGTPLDDIYNSKEQCRQDTAPMHIQPGNGPPHLFFGCDPDDEFWFRGNDRLREKLLALGVEHECDLNTRAGGHSWQYFNHMAPRAIKFVHAGLEKQSLRLI